MMVTAVACKKRGLELRQLHHQLQPQSLHIELLGPLDVANLDHHMADPFRLNHSIASCQEMCSPTTAFTYSLIGWSNAISRGAARLRRYRSRAWSQSPLRVAFLADS